MTNSLGCAERVKLKGKRYRLSESVQRFCAYKEQYAIERTKGVDDAYIAAQAERMAALAQIEQLRARQIRGELVKVADVDFWISSSFFSTVGKWHRFTRRARCRVRTCDFLRVKQALFH